MYVHEKILFCVSVSMREMEIKKSKIHSGGELDRGERKEKI